MRIAINGFGRIGRSVFRILHGLSDMQIVAINDLFDREAMRYQLNYDTVMGPFPGGLYVENEELVTPSGRVKMLAVSNPLQLPWKELGIDAVIEATGKFRKRVDAEKHLTAGARRVILTVPAKDDIDYTVVLGVNDDGLKPEHRIISNASCTTNCLAPMAKVLHDTFGIVEGFINTVHAYTNDQRLADVPHTDWRRSRAAAKNIIPTSTGAAKAVGQVMPELKGKLDGIATRVPVLDGSVVSLYVNLDKEVSVERVDELVKTMSETSQFAGILQFTDRPVVSTDIIGNPNSSIYDASFTQVTSGHYLKTLNWYDNEWGYSNRVCDLLMRLSEWK